MWQIPEVIKELHLDLETFSSTSIKNGVYAYSEAKDADVLLLGYAINDDPITVVDVANGEKPPDYVLKALNDKSVIKWAHNASFERIFLSNWLKRFYPEHFKPYLGRDGNVIDYLDPHSWCCTMIWAAYMGLPLSLEGVGAVLGLDKQKLLEGKDLIRYFCVPCKPTKTNGGRTRNMPSHAPDKWKQFREYNERDVEVERAIHSKLSSFPVPDEIWNEYWLDQEINDRGVLVDMDVVENALRFENISNTRLIEKLKELTDLDNPNSIPQLKSWLETKGIKTESLDKKTIQALLKAVPNEVAVVLQLREQLAKSSVLKKYQAMKNTVCADGRVHGMFQFYGANRTGRWAGRYINLQNLPQTHMPDLEVARDIVKSGDFELMNILYDDVPDVLSQLIRTAFIPKPGYKFCVADFSAIEARVLAYLAGETWRIEAFRDGKDIYCASASRMFGVPVEKHGMNSHLRQKGKVAELALGYGGSVGALKSMGAVEMGVPEEEMQQLVVSWRRANSKIVSLWWNVDRAIRTCLKQRTQTQVQGIRFYCQGPFLLFRLHSSRCISYLRPRIGEGRFGGECITYEGIGTNKNMERIESYGPKFVENIVQAISRDILAYAMRTLSNYSIVAHVHDELIIEVPMDTDIDVICKQMSKTPEWIPGLILNADGFSTQFYMKS